MCVLSKKLAPDNKLRPLALPNMVVLGPLPLPYKAVLVATGTTIKESVNGALYTAPKAISQ